MLRKQIYLTPEIDRELKVIARQQGRTVAEIVREILEDKLRIKKSPKESGGAVLLRMAARATDKGPRDLSTNMFDYLYGDKSPNYGKNAPKLTKAEIKRIDKFVSTKDETLR